MYPNIQIVWIMLTGCQTGLVQRWRLSRNLWVFLFNDVKLKTKCYLYLLDIWLLSWHAHQVASVKVSKSGFKPEPAKQKRSGTWSCADNQQI